MSTIKHWVDLGVLGEIEVEVDYYFSPGSPGKLTGAYEDSYPPEPPTVDVLKVTPDFDGRIAAFLDDDEDFYHRVFDVESEEEDRYSEWREAA